MKVAPRDIPMDRLSVQEGEAIVVVRAIHDKILVSITKGGIVKAGKWLTFAEFLKLLEGAQ